MPSPRHAARLRQALGNIPEDPVDDLNPRNLMQIDQQMRRRDVQDPRQQAILQQERKRLEQVQGQKMQQAAQQQFQQRLEQRLNPRIGTQEDSDPQALFMFKLIQQMRQGRPMPPEMLQVMQGGMQ